MEDLLQTLLAPPPVGGMNLGTQASRVAEEGERVLEGLDHCNV